MDLDREQFRSLSYLPSTLRSVAKTNTINAHLTISGPLKLIDRFDTHLYLNIYDSAYT